MNLFFLKINNWLLGSLCIFLFAILLQSCNDDPALVPKPRGYPKVVYPEKNYQAFGEGYCDFTFEYPKYAQIVQDLKFFGEKPLDDCWFDIFIEQFNAKIHCTYSNINSRSDFEKLKADAFELAHKHNIKAKAIEEIPITTANGVKGFAFNLDGEVASPFQFYLSDEENHFLRGSLYFNSEVAPDSLAPISNFLKKDIEHLINSLKWKE